MQCKNGAPHRPGCRTGARSQPGLADTFGELPQRPRRRWRQIRYRDHMALPCPPNRGTSIEVDTPQFHPARFLSPYLTTAEAQIYLGYRSPGGIRMAFYRGWLKPGGRGPRRTWLFTKEALDAFVALGARATVDGGCRLVRGTTEDWLTVALAAGGCFPRRWGNRITTPRAWERPSPIASEQST